MNISSVGPLMPSSSGGVSGGSPSSTSTLEASQGLSSPPSVVEQFLAYARMSPMERMRASILNGMGLSEDDLNAMSPADREKVEAKIKQLIEEKIKEAQKEKGQFVDFAV
jgi:hypothetical protein